MNGPVLRLPLAAWAARFSHGTAEIHGRLADPLRCPVPGGPEVFPAGPIALSFAFGGPPPAFTAVRLGDHPFGPDVERAAVVAAAVDALHDLSVTVRAEVLADGLSFAIAPGLAATVPARTGVQVRGVLRGAPSRPRLAGPLVIEVDGAGVSVGGVHIHVISLAPDGEIGLATAPHGRMSRVVNGGLRPVARHLTDLVRTSPRLAELRGWLVLGPP